MFYCVQIDNANKRQRMVINKLKCKDLYCLKFSDEVYQATVGVLKREFVLGKHSFISVWKYILLFMQNHTK